MLHPHAFSQLKLQRQDSYKLYFFLLLLQLFCKLLPQGSRSFELKLRASHTKCRGLEMEADALRTTLRASALFVRGGLQEALCTAAQLTAMAPHTVILPILHIK